MFWSNNKRNSETNVEIVVGLSLVALIFLVLRVESCVTLLLWLKIFFLKILAQTCFYQIFCLCRRILGSKPFLFILFYFILFYFISISTTILFSYSCLFWIICFIFYSLIFNIVQCFVNLLVQFEIMSIRMIFSLLFILEIQWTSSRFFCSSPS